MLGLCGPFLLLLQWRLVALFLNHSLDIYLTQGNIKETGICSFIFSIDGHPLTFLHRINFQDTLTFNLLKKMKSINSSYFVCMNSVIVANFFVLMFHLHIIIAKIVKESSE